MRPDELRKEIEALNLSVEKFTGFVLENKLTTATVRNYLRYGIDPTRVDWIKRRIKEYKLCSTRAYGVDE